MSLTELIGTSEEKLLIPLEDFFRSYYRDNHLVSHGLDHHRRVWKYAKEILGQKSSKGAVFDKYFIEKLLIACYLHDIGMIRDAGRHHGQFSMEICKEFLEANRLTFDEFKDVLVAIRDHDNKEYISRHEDDSLLLYLSIADDLDAFGYTGIYRYSEIYIVRGTDPAELGYQILENAACRFDNFRSVFVSYPEFIERHQKQYNVLTDFFHRYNDQVSSYRFRSASPSGYCGVIEIINEIIENKADPVIYFRQHVGMHTDNLIAKYFEGLSEEL